MKLCKKCGKQNSDFVTVCHFCGFSLSNMAANPPPKAQSVLRSSPYSKKCPYCGEMIKSEAKKCRFCGEWIDQEIATKEIQASPSSLPALAKGLQALSSLIFLGLAIYIGWGAFGSSFQSKSYTPMIAPEAVATTAKAPATATTDKPRSFPTSTATPADKIVTLSQFNDISTGMTYEQVVRIIGSPGVEQSRNEIVGIVTILYEWRNPNYLDGAMNAMFQNGKLVQKSQFMLK